MISTPNLNHLFWVKYAESFITNWTFCIWSNTTEPTEKDRKELDQLLVKILGSEDVADELYRRCSRY